MSVYKDDFGNTAIIETIKHFPYREAKKKVKSFRLIVSSDYDNNSIYFVSVYETEERALNKLKEFSCGTFQKVEGSMEK